MAASATATAGDAARYREEPSPVSWNEILCVNLMSYIFCAKAAVPLMRKGGGGFSLFMGLSVTYSLFFAAPCPRFGRGWRFGGVGRGTNFMVCSLGQRRFRVKEMRLHASSAKGDRPVRRAQGLGCNAVRSMPGIVRMNRSGGFWAASVPIARPPKSTERHEAAKSATASPWTNMTRTARQLWRHLSGQLTFPIGSIGGNHLIIVSKI